MRGFTARSLTRYVVGASAVALATAPGVAWAQDAASTVGQPGDSEIPAQATDTGVTEAGDEIVVTGIRASLRQAVDIKRNAQGVVDAISAEDIGKFPDTNLAESLQRITGVSIDRSNGEGSTVTVRGFGPEYNLVTLNGRQIATASLGDGGSPPSSRSFDFANLASEGVAAVEVYKTGRASVFSGGIGSTINIRTPRPLDRPGFRASLSAKGVYDTSENDSTSITPEFSGIVSSTFGADDQFGVTLTGIYQRRKSSNNVANVGYRDGYLGSENNWGSLAQPGDPRFANIINRPEANDVYEVPQNASYDLNDVDRERINGQLVLQWRPTENLTFTADYLYARNTVEVRNSNVGIWFNHNDTSSEWTDGPVAGPVFYAERFGPPAGSDPGKDLSYSGALTANRTLTQVFGGNLTWEAASGVTVTLDAAHSTAESKPTNRFGSSMSFGNAIFGVQSQRIDFDTKGLPVFGYTMYPGIDPLNAGNIRTTGNAFRNAYFRDEINQGQLRTRYDHEGGFLDSLDFGITYTENKVRSAFGFLQNDTWGGSTTAAEVPDDLFALETLPDKFKGLAGADKIPASFYTFDVPTLVDFLDKLRGICGGDGNCLADYTTDRRIKERVIAPFVQFNNRFDLFSRPANLIAGLRYEYTEVDSAALVPIPVGTQQNSDNEFSVLFGPERDFTSFKGKYRNLLPSVDFDIEPFEDFKLRASYSHTITRSDYASLQGGQTIDTLFRIGNGFGSVGNPGLLPFKSKNIDLSAEWYYGRESYLSVGYFNKDVENFISSERINQTAFGLTNPGSGPRVRAARAALGPTASGVEIREYILANFPGTAFRNAQGQVIVQGQPGDDPVIFQIATPVNSDETANIYGFEFAIQHNFWDTGFGAILNYTIVKGDVTYDRTQPASVTQFALTGLSDSANAVLFYDKAGLQGRVAYNWRDEFLAGTGPNPFYVEAYGQIDASASYEFMPGLTVFGEVINLTGESRRGHRRSDRNVFFASPGFARYSAGLRFTL
nr:TonB-dependent receptor [uncultured Sphingosinicella sp.]